MIFRGRKGDIIECGDEVVDKITGFEGIVTGVTTFMAGCVRVAVSPRKLKPDGTVIEAQIFDEPNLKVKKRNVMKPTFKKTTSIKLGDRVRHKINGYQGIVAAESIHLSQPRTLGIASEKVKKDDGTVLDMAAFDEEMLELVAEDKIEPKKARTGGNQKIPNTYR